LSARRIRWACPGHAGWFGAVLIGGIGSLIVAGLWMMLFPDLRHLDRFQPAESRKLQSAAKA